MNLAYYENVYKYTRKYSIFVSVYMFIGRIFKYILSKSA
jgi:hypothetical protein